MLRCAACCGRKSGATGLREGWDARNGQSRRVRLQTRSGAPVGSRGVVGCLGSPCGGLCSPKAQYRYRRCAGLVAAGQFFPSERCVYLTAEWRVDGRRWERGGLTLGRSALATRHADRHPKPWAGSILQNYATALQPLSSSPSSNSSTQTNNLSPQSSRKKIIIAHHGVRLRQLNRPPATL